MGSTAIKSTKATNKGDKASMQQLKMKLQKGLAELEKQYTEIMSSVKKNKENRAHIAKEGKIIQNKMRRLSGELEKFTPYAQRQLRFLQKLQEFQKDNESLVAMIAEQLNQIESPKNVKNTDKKELRKDLINMLGELRDMKKRRESLLKKIK